MFHLAIFIHAAIFYELYFHGQIALLHEKIILQMHKKSVEIPVIIEIKEENQSEENNESKALSQEEELAKRLENPESFFESYDFDKEKWGDLKERLKKSLNLESEFEQVFEELNDKSDAPESYIYRKRHHDDLVVKDVFPTLDDIEKPFTDTLKKSPEKLKDYRERNKIIDDFRKWTKGELNTAQIKIQIDQENQEGYPPLQFPENERDEYFDKTLPLPKEEQFDFFRRRYLPHDPNKGDLPEVLRDLYYKNLLRLVNPFSNDNSYFILDYFEENLNKEDYLKNALDVASKLAGTKTAIETLFTIDSIYEVQMRAFSFYFRFERDYQKKSTEQKKRLRNETLRRIIERYKPQLNKKKIYNYRDVVMSYSNKRLQIMDYILNTTPRGYRRYDAIFEKARILWDKGIYTGNQEASEAAIKLWKKIPSNIAAHEIFLNHETHQNISKIINNFKRKLTRNDLMKIRHQISNILNRRLEKYLKEKKEREYRILWPDNKKITP